MWLKWMRLKIKYNTTLLTWPLLVLLLLLKIKFLLLVISSKKNKKKKTKNKQTNYNTKITKIKKKITDQSHDKYITTPEFNKFMAKFLI